MEGTVNKGQETTMRDKVEAVFDRHGIKQSNGYPKYGAIGEVVELFNQELEARVKEAELKTEIRIHDEYWHSQRLVEENGIGPVALANKEAAELDLRKLSQPKETL